MSDLKRLTLSLPLFGILTMLAASTVAAQPRPSAPVIRDNSAPATAPTPPSSRGENFSANKTPAQLFASDCTGAGCHKGAGGLAKNSSSLGLTGFLREHYTNSRESASALAAYLMGAAGSGPADRPARGEPATPRPPRAAARTPAAGEEAKPEEGQGPLRPAQRRQGAPGTPAVAPGAAATPAGETPAEIVRPEPGAKPAPAAAQRNQPQRGRQHQTAAPTPPPEAAPAPPPPPPPPPVVHDIFD